MVKRKWTKVICTRVVVSKGNNSNDGRYRKGCRFDYPLYSLIKKTSKLSEAIGCVRNE